MPNKNQGRIVKVVRGIYYAATGEESIPCNAKGAMRLTGKSPCVGDFVDFDMNDDGTGTITDIHVRKNSLIRPPLANLDYMLMIVSVAAPMPNLYVADKFLAILEHKDIPPCVVITKSDIADGAEELADKYRQIGYPVFVISSETGEGVPELKDFLADKLCAFSGNSGVGKSSLLNALDSSFAIQVGDISKKLGRGRHTTRHVELFRLDNNALIADTPGFSTVEITAMSDISKDSLPYCFKDFEPYLGGCRFVNCSHTKEKDCKILEAIEKGEIQKSRHESYIQMYNEVKDLKEWEK